VYAHFSQDLAPLLVIHRVHQFENRGIEQALSQEDRQLLRPCGWFPSSATLLSHAGFLIVSLVSGLMLSYLLKNFFLRLQAATAAR
jgi:hypothetical protein